jgi:hypothetical protein
VGFNGILERDFLSEKRAPYVHCGSDTLYLEEPIGLLQHPVAIITGALHELAARFLDRESWMSVPPPNT